MAALSYVGANILTAATLSMTSQDAAYPATNGNDRDPGKPLKSSGATTTITATWSGNKTIQAWAVINHNRPSTNVAIANAAGYSQNLALPARSADLLNVNGFRDTRADANTTDDIWTLGIATGTGNAAIGEIVAVETLSALNWRYGVSFSSRRPVKVSGRTFYGALLQYDTAVLLRTARGIVIKESDRQLIFALWQTTRGNTLPFLFIPEITINDPWLVRFGAETVEWVRNAPNVSNMTIVLEEVANGLIL
jgi:hypothetical protein